MEKLILYACTVTFPMSTLNFLIWKTDKIILQLLSYTHLKIGYWFIYTIKIDFMFVFSVPFISVNLPTNFGRVIQIAAGSHHTIALTGK